MTGTKAPVKKRPRPTNTPPPEDPLEAQLPISEPDEAEWAERGDVSLDPWHDDVLPHMQKKVRIRYLGNVEAASLAFLPDLGFANVMLDVLGSKEEVSREEVRVKLAEQEKNRAKYMVRVAHMCVVDRSEPFQVRPCEDCGVEHPPALWTMAQADRIDLNDLMFITRIAEQEEALGGVRPFSPETMPSSSEPSADTGASTPPTSS